jgi:hypothetical protein
VLDVEAWGSLDGELELGRSAWPVVDMGNAVAPMSAAECSTSRPRDHSTWSWYSAARRVPVVDQGNVVAPCLPGVLNVEAWGSLDVELKLGRSAWHVVDLGNAVAPMSAAEWSTSRPGDRSAWPIKSLQRFPGKRSAWPRGRPGKRGRSLPARSLDVEAWGSLDGELKLGRSAWPVVDQGNAVAPLSVRSLNVEAWGSLDVELKLGRSMWG